MNNKRAMLSFRELYQHVSRLSWLLLFIPLAISLFALDSLCYWAALPVSLTFRGGAANIVVGNEPLTLTRIAAPTAVIFPEHDPVVHEYQIDGTDSTNNFTLDTTYLHQISSSPYYMFQSWMRDLDGTSRWRDLSIRIDGKLLGSTEWPPQNAQTSLPAAGSIRIDLALQRPETPMTLDISTSDGGLLQLVIDRNDRYYQVTRSLPGQPDQTLGKVFFPTDPIAFAAMVIDFLVRTALWAILVVIVVSVLECGIGSIPWRLKSGSLSWGDLAKFREDFLHDVRRALLQMPRAFSTLQERVAQRWQQLCSAVHPVGLCALGASFIFVSWIALVQYHAQAHIYDASAYLFGAKIVASGNLWVPLPPAADRFPGPFMVQVDGRWFPQYAPGTYLTLAPGIWLGLAWLVEPVLGTLALLGIGLIAARLYDRRVATLAIVLGVLSPFYSYLAASYLSHTIALFYLVSGLWFFLRFVQGAHDWNLLAATFLFGMAALTRDTAFLFIAVAVPGILFLSRAEVRRKWKQWLVPLLPSGFLALLFLLFNLAVNASLTGDPRVTPRQLFFAGDHWGFGQGVGFYGQHTLAAGFVNVHELLTILAIDLFGWPFYLTLAFLLIPFLVWRAHPADWLMAAGILVITGAFVGYFYHGIYLGPRYLFESLPFLLILTARGIFTLGEASLEVRIRAMSFLRGMHSEGTRRLARPVSLATIGLVLVLVACNLFYFLPRQITLYQNFTGLPAGENINTEVFNHPPVHDAIVVTDNYQLYGYTLFSLNDPYFRGDVLYAWASDAADYKELQTAFPGRKLYRVDIGGNGSVSFVPISG